MKIHKLAPHEAQKIAAGEIVERPANILKELIENSVDAGATAISIALEEGGKNLISIIDNGTGMEPADARICCERHTTSKLSSLEQLHSINSFGFRGEALASICSVAHVTLISKTTDARHALELSIEDGTIINERTVSAQKGTTVRVQDLFYNVPARKKFLKTTATEWNQCLMIFKAAALANPNIHYELKNNDSLVFNCPPVQTVAQRMAQLFETGCAQALTPLEEVEEPTLTVSGVITAAPYTRYDKSALFFFVNKRWIKNYQLAQALIKGYANILPPGKYPAGAVHITLDPHLVDINVHPKKEEVKFLNPRIVETAITHAVKSTLEQQFSSAFVKTSADRSAFVSPSLNELGRADKTPADKSAFAATTLQGALKGRPSLDCATEPFTMTPAFFASSFSHATQKKQETRSGNLSPQTIEKELAVVSSPQSFSQQFPEPFSESSQKHFVPETQTSLDSVPTWIGTYRNTYLLFEQEDGLLFIDQHAAHERILYERFLHRFSEMPSVALLFPVIITLSAHSVGLLERYLPLFGQYGLQLEVVGKEQLALKGTPLFLKNQSVDDLISQAVAWIEELETVDPTELHEQFIKKLRAQMACKAAVKAGDKLDQETIRQLIADLETVDNRFSCPHGRPTSWTISLHEIERKFKRRKP